MTALPEGRVEETFSDKRPLYTRDEAIAEANRCIYCVDAPCVNACPTSIDIPTFIRKIGTGNTQGAARTILEANLLGQSCAQVCPVEVLCAGSCVYNAWDREPIAIGRLQRYAVETTIEKNPNLLRRKSKSGKKIALVGSGPASIAAAGWLALGGHSATIFERKAFAGGLNTLGIAPYKMKGDEALAEIDWVLSLGDVEMKSGIEVVEKTSGPNQIDARTLLKDYDAVFLGLGLGNDSTLGVAGEAGPGVYGATYLIERLKSDPSLTFEGVRRAVVVGGGNTAIDIAHELAICGVEVTMVYRRGRDAMSGYDHEIDGAKKDAVRLLLDRAPVSFVRNGERLVGLEVAPARNGRALAGASAETLPCDLVAIAIGQNRATGIARAFDGVELDDKGRIVVDPKTHRTGNPRVWAGGDAVNGGKEVVNAVAEAKIAVADIDRALGGHRG